MPSLQTNSVRDTCTQIVPCVLVKIKRKSHLMDKSKCGHLIARFYGDRWPKLYHLALDESSDEDQSSRSFQAIRLGV